MKKENDGNLKQIFALIETITNEPTKIIAVPSELIHFVGSTQKAVFLSQLIYWSDKGSRSDGYIFKTKKEWHEETGLSENQVSRFTNEFKESGFLDTKVKKAFGNPTVHYKLDIHKLAYSIRLFLLDRYSENKQNELPETSESLTENTQDNTQDNFIERGLSDDNHTSLLANNNSDLDEISKGIQDVSKEEPNSDVHNSCTEKAESAISEKILLSEDFTPTLDEKYRSTLAFPQKSPSYVTQKFIKYYGAKKLKMTRYDWHGKWWDWMVKESPSYGNLEVEKEHFEIERQVETQIWDALYRSSKRVVSLTEIVSASRGIFSPETVESALESLRANENLVRIEDYFYNLQEYESNDEWKDTVDKELETLGLTIPSTAKPFSSTMFERIAN